MSLTVAETPPQGLHGEMLSMLSVCHLLIGVQGDQLINSISFSFYTNPHILQHRGPWRPPVKTLPEDGLPQTFGSQPPQ